METAYERFWVSIVIVCFVNVIVMKEIVFCSMSWVKRIHDIIWKIVKFVGTTVSAVVIRSSPSRFLYCRFLFKWVRYIFYWAILVF